MKKLHVAVLFGGRSGEHEVSLMSARSVLSVLDPAKYDVTQIGITHEGKWLTGEDVLGKHLKMDSLEDLVPAVIFPDPPKKDLFIDGGSGLRKWSDIDVFFPVFMEHSAKMEQCRVCSNWQMLLMWVRAWSVPPLAWIKASSRM